MKKAKKIGQTPPLIRAELLPADIEHYCGRCWTDRHNNTWICDSILQRYLDLFGSNNIQGIIYDYRPGPHALRLTPKKLANGITNFRVDGGKTHAIHYRAQELALKLLEKTLGASLYIEFDLLDQ